jgi:hypothetical protein
MALLRFERNPPPRQLRQFAVLWMPATFALLGWIVYRRVGTWNGALLTWAIGAALSAAGAVWPSVARAVWVAWMTLAYPVGWVVSHLVLAAAYYVVITPMGWLMRAAGHDPMHRRFDPRATSYWKAHDPGTSKSRYLRQF